jgi:hypothetical protein
VVSPYPQPDPLCWAPFCTVGPPLGRDYSPDRELKRAQRRELLVAGKPTTERGSSGPGAALGTGRDEQQEEGDVKGEQTPRTKTSYSPPLARA